VPLKYAKPMIEFAEANRLALAVYVDEYFWRLEGTHIYMQDMAGPAWREARSFDEVLTQAPTFIRFLGIESVEAMKREFGDLPLSFRYESWLDFVECAVLSREASKQTALARLCADFGVPAERVLAIGDSRNDVPMMQWAGVGVAMGNALPEVRHAVRYVTATNERDGVALAIEKFALRADRADKKTA
jgi:hydroxymethylpyrimidine pyrophosphatase-like HAD family hydrolase